MWEKQQVYDSVGEETGGSLEGREAGRAPDPRSLDCVCILSSLEQKTETVVGKGARAQDSHLLNQYHNKEVKEPLLLSLFSQISLESYSLGWHRFSRKKWQHLGWNLLHHCFVHPVIIPAGSQEPVPASASASASLRLRNAYYLFLCWMCYSFIRPTQDFNLVYSERDRRKLVNIKENCSQHSSNTSATWKSLNSC